eukprot:5349414-Lingulodinium_polyedra.AAC.1
MASLFSLGRTMFARVPCRRRRDGQCISMLFVCSGLRPPSACVWTLALRVASGRLPIGRFLSLLPSLAGPDDEH